MKPCLGLKSFSTDEPHLPPQFSTMTVISAAVSIMPCGMTPCISTLTLCLTLLVYGASMLASLFYTKGVFCIAYQYFLWVVSVTLCNNAYWIFGDAM